MICGNKADLEAPGAVSRSEVEEALGEDVSFFETSAKDGTGLEAAFRALATLGGLPVETSPSRHQLVSILTYQSMCTELHQRPAAGAEIQQATQTREVSDSMNLEPSHKPIVVVCCNVLLCKGLYPHVAPGWTSALKLCFLYVTV